MAALQFEIQGLLQQLNGLQDELADITHTIHTFELRHTQELGSVILQLLALRKKAAGDKVKEQPDNTTAQQQFEEAEKEESDYSETFEETKHTILHALSDEEAAELKTKYWKISRLTHPDVVDKQFEKEAAGLFIKAQEAREHNDLATIRELLNYLESGQPFTLRHQSITAAEELRIEAARLHFLIEDLQKQLSSLRESDTYKSITGIQDWEAYFENARRRLEDEVAWLTAENN